VPVLFVRRELEKRLRVEQLVEIRGAVRGKGCVLKIC
jgi:hypothetical protein